MERNELVAELKARGDIGGKIKYAAMKILLVGEGAQGLTHCSALGQIEGVEVVALCGGDETVARCFAGMLTQGGQGGPAAPLGLMFS